MLTASSEPCIGTDGQVASISRENHAFCAGRADLLPDYSVKERLKRQHAKIRLRNVVPYGNLALNRPSLGGHLGNVGFIAIIDNNFAMGIALTKVVILAGGLGTRIGEETATRPKPMVEIGGMPILWHIMKIYASHGLNDFIICLGYKGYVIKEFFANYFLHLADVTIDLANNSIEVHEAKSEPWKVTLVDTGSTSQTGGRLKAVRRFLDDGKPFCFTYGDGVSDIDITSELAFHRTHGRKATIASVAPPGRFGALQFEGDRVIGFSEKPAGDGGLINGGFFVLEPSVIDLIDGPETIWEDKPLETLARTDELMSFHHQGFWQPMDTLRDKQLLERLWGEGNAPWKRW